MNSKPPQEMKTVPLLLFAIVFLCFQRTDSKVNMSSPIDEFLVGTNAKERNKSITLLASMNYGGYISFGPICSKTVETVLETISNNSDWLPGYNLSIELVDDQCDDAVTVRESSIKLLRDASVEKRIPFMLLGACSTDGTALVAKVLKSINFIGTTWIIKRSDYLTNPERYSGVYQASSQTFDAYYAIVQLLEAMNWSKLAIFSEDVQFFNSMEATIQQVISHPNISVHITYIGPKVPTLSVDNIDKVIATMDELKKSEARIMLGHTNNHIAFSCWLYKYGMYGPNYVILATTWAIFDPETAKIPNFLSWCTKDMLKKVVGSWVYFGFGRPVDIYGESYTDALGLRNQDIIDALSKKIEDSDSVPTRDMWWPECYDPALIGLLAIGEVEKILHERYNSTLSEWTTGSSNFIENGQFIADLFRESIDRIDIVHGANGFYKFDSKSGKNVDGFQPTIFYQRRYTNESHPSLITLPVMYYKSNDDKLIPMSGGFLFGGSKRVPTDSVLQVLFEVELISQSLVIVLCVLAVLEILGSVFFIYQMAIEKSHRLQAVRHRLKSFKTKDIFLLCSIIVFLSSVFAIPNGKQGIGIVSTYETHTFLLVFGFSLLLTGLLLKTLSARTAIFNYLNSSERARVYSNRLSRSSQSTAWSVSSNSSGRSSYGRLTYFSKAYLRQIVKGTNKSAILISLWPLIQVSLVIAFIRVGTFSKPETKFLESFYSKDTTVVYKPYQLYYPVSFLRNTDYAFELFLALISSNALAIFYCIYFCYSTIKLMKSAKRTSDVFLISKMNDFKMTTAAIYCFSILLTGVILISFTLSWKTGVLIIISPFAVLTCCFIFLSIIFLPKFTAKRIHVRPTRVRK